MPISESVVRRVLVNALLLTSFCIFVISYYVYFALTTAFCFFTPYYSRIEYFICKER